MGDRDNRRAGVQADKDALLALPVELRRQQGGRSDSDSADGLWLRRTARTSPRCFSQSTVPPWPLASIPGLGGWLQPVCPSGCLRAGVWSGRREIEWKYSRL